MIRIVEFRTAALRMATITSVALLLAMPRAAAAQAAPAQEDPLKLGASVPTMILIQIHADKTADFESAWGSIKAGLAKSTKDDEKAFGESLAKLYKVDQPPTAIGDAKVMIYILQVDAPSTAISYNPFKVVYETMWKNGAAEGALLTRPEADAIYEKLKAAFQNINPPWKLVKVG
jgi:hypothetical protein